MSLGGYCYYFGFSVTLGGTQGLFLTIFSGNRLGGLRRPYVVPEIIFQLAMFEASSLSAILSL